jgi:hypothetical protein
MAGCVCDSRSLGRGATLGAHVSAILVPTDSEPHTVDDASRRGTVGRPGPVGAVSVLLTL